MISISKLENCINFVKPYHSDGMHISMCFFSDDKYSVLTIVCNYLQMNNQISLFLKKICVRKLHRKV